jgi:hypothetical protein
MVSNEDAQGRPALPKFSTRWLSNYQNLWDQSATRRLRPASQHHKTTQNSELSAHVKTFMGSSGSLTRLLRSEMEV